MPLHRRTVGFFDGSYFTGMEASLRTPCIARWPNHIASGVMRNEIMHVTDSFTTLLTMAQLAPANDRIIDGKDQTAFLSGEQEASNRDGFVYWNGEQIYVMKWRNFEWAMVAEKHLTDPALPLGFPHIVKLRTDPKEREPFNPVYPHTWTSADFGRLIAESTQSVAQDPLIPAGAPRDFVPKPQ